MHRSIGGLRLSNCPKRLNNGLSGHCVSRLNGPNTPSNSTRHFSMWQDFTARYRKQLEESKEYKESVDDLKKQAEKVGDSRVAKAVRGTGEAVSQRSGAVGAVISFTRRILLIDLISRGLHKWAAYADSLKHPPMFFWRYHFDELEKRLAQLRSDFRSEIDALVRQRSSDQSQQINEIHAEMQRAQQALVSSVVTLVSQETPRGLSSDMDLSCGVVSRGDLVALAADQDASVTVATTDLVVSSGATSSSGNYLATSVSTLASAWEGLKVAARKTAVFQALLGASEAVRMSENAAIQRALEVSSEAREVMSKGKEAILPATEQAMTFAVLARRTGGEFEEEAVARELRDVAVRSLLEAIQSGDTRTLRRWCGEAQYAQLFAAAKARQAEQLRMDSLILDVKAVDLHAAVRDGNDANLVYTFHAVQTHCVRNAKNEVVEGAPDDIQAVYYSLALKHRDVPLEPVELVAEEGEEPQQIDSTEDGDGLFREWEVVALVVHSTHPSW